MLRGPENRGAEFETPKASSRGGGMGRGYPPNQPTRGSGARGSVVSSPSGRKQILVHFELEKSESDDDKFDIVIL